MLALFLGVLKYFSLNQTFLLNLDLGGTHNQSSYSTANLIKSYVKEFFIFIPHLVIVVSLILTSSLIYNYSKISNRFPLFATYLVLLFFVAFSNYHTFSFTSNIKYFVPAFCLPPLLFSLIKKDEFSTVVIIILIITITQVAGTNTGLFLKFNYGFLLLLPLSIIIIANQENIEFENISINTKATLIIGVSFIFLLSGFARFGWIYNVDSGINSRLRATYTVQHNLMKGIFTTKKNASHIKRLSDAIESNISKDNTLFIYGHEPMFYYLTNHQPPIKKFWLINNFVQVDELFLSLNESSKLTGKWPMIVDTKQSIIKEVGEIKLAEFLNSNNYKLIKEESDFNIWNKIPK